MAQTGSVTSIGRTTWAVAIWLGVAGCNQSGIGPTESLVGADELPPINELARETIEINRDSFVGGDRHILGYELRPDNTLHVAHILRGYDGDSVVAEDSLRLAPEPAQRIRRALWRVRPEKLRGVEYVDYPVGCEPPLDSGMEAAVVFVGQGDNIGIFGLPHACKDRQAAVARALMSDVMQWLPSSKVAQAFPESD